MGKRKLILHVGYSKCGSSTIQETLTGNYDRLLRDGVLFPRTLSESPSWLRFFWEPNLPVTYSEERVRNKFADFIAKLNKEVDDTAAGTIILSDEGLISLPSSGVNALKDFLSDFFEGYEVEVVCIVREPISFFASRCQQFISDRYFDDAAIENFIEGNAVENGEVRSDCSAMNPEFLFSKNIEKYRHFFKKVKVLKFESAVRDGSGFTSYFLKSLGLDNNIEDIRLNESRSGKAIEVISYINSKMPFNVPSGLWKYRKYGDSRFFYDLRGPKYILPESLKMKLIDRVEDEVEWLKENYGVEYRKNASELTSSKVFWDEVFYEDAVHIFPKLPFHLKVLFKSFVFSKLEDPSFSQDEGILLTSKWLKENYPFICACNNSVALLFMRTSCDFKSLIVRAKVLLRPFLYALIRGGKGSR